jgi:tRNA G18 (ribose-2'-O)-methylase SpoU
MTDTKNVIDYYKYWEVDAIKADLDTRRFPFATLCCNIQGDFNLGSVIRSNNAFLGERVYIYGKRRWDKRADVGTRHYEHVTRLGEDSLDSFYAGEGKQYTWIGVDNVPGAIDVSDFVWPEKPLLCFGEEQAGVDKRILERCKNVVYIRQYGSVRSLNVGVAAGIMMQDFVTKYTKLNKL